MWGGRIRPSTARRSGTPLARTGCKHWWRDTSTQRRAGHRRFNLRCQSTRSLDILQGGGGRQLARPDISRLGQQWLCRCCNPHDAAHRLTIADRQIRIGAAAEWWARPGLVTAATEGQHEAEQSNSPHKGAFRGIDTVEDTTDCARRQSATQGLLGSSPRNELMIQDAIRSGRLSGSRIRSPISRQIPEPALSLATAITFEAFGQIGGLPSAGRYISSFGNTWLLNPSTRTRSTGARRAIRSLRRVPVPPARAAAPSSDRGDHHLARARLPVAVAVLARPVDVEAVMRALDGRDTQRRAPSSGIRADEQWSCRCRTIRRAPAPSCGQAAPPPGVRAAGGTPPSDSPSR